MIEKDPKKKRLTKKQDRFVQEYIKDQNITQAAIRAGFAKNSAYTAGNRAFKYVHVRCAIENRLEKSRKKLEEEAGITALWVVRELRKNHMEARKKKNFAASTRALELIGKHVGAFEEDNKQKNPKIEDILREATNEELENMLNEKNK